MTMTKPSSSCSLTVTGLVSGAAAIVVANRVTADEKHEQRQARFQHRFFILAKKDPWPGAPFGPVREVSVGTGTTTHTGAIAGKPQATFMMKQFCCQRVVRRHSRGKPRV